MPHPSVTVYDLLLSCPGDVLDLKSTIEECVKSFNSTIGEINNLRVELKHWTTDSFPQSGDKPQEILNKQFVTSCDMCVALLGVRFGTPTDNYDSGTEEEIETMLVQGKQVFLYFVERNVDPSTINTEQLEKVKQFKEKYTKKGIYSVVKTADELRKAFQNALTMYLIKLVAPITPEFQSKLSPDLIISSHNLSNDTIELNHSDLQNVRLVEDKKRAICEIISNINELKVELSDNNEEKAETPIFSDEEISKMKFGELTKAANEGKITLLQMGKWFGKSVPVIKKAEINGSDKALVQNFCKEYNVSVSDNFWDLGNLKKEFSTPILKLYAGDTITYIGSDSEKRKLELLSDLVSRISEFNDIVGFFLKIDNLYNVSFFISNDGTTFDEDVDIRLYVDKGHIVKPVDMPQPGVLFIDEVVDNDAPKYLFAGYHDPEIDDYSNYPASISYIPPTLPYPLESAEENLKKQQKKYLNQIEDIFCYDIRENENEDIFMFNIPYLKQNTKMFFPSFLFFQTIPERIRYEIRSKHSPNVYSKVFKIAK